jgi:hypothetical protein
MGYGIHPMQRRGVAHAEKITMSKKTKIIELRITYRPATDWQAESGEKLLAATGAAIVMGLQSNHKGNIASYAIATHEE